MPRSVICISHEAGAGGRELAAGVAERLGYRYVDEEVMARAATAEGVSVDELVDVERRKSFIARLMVDFGRSGAPLYATAGVPMVLITETAAPDRLRSAIRSAIEELASDGRVVIVSHAASHALVGDHPLRVLVVAPDEVRTQRIAEAGDGIQDKASKRMAEEDAARRDYLKRFYRISRESAVNYDLVVNTGHIAPTALVPIVAAAADL